jgi:hypothetical protein
VRANTIEAVLHVLCCHLAAEGNFHYAWVTNVNNGTWQISESAASAIRKSSEDWICDSRVGYERYKYSAIERLRIYDIKATIQTTSCCDKIQTN